MPIDDECSGECHSPVHGRTCADPVERFVQPPEMPRLADSVMSAVRAGVVGGVVMTAVLVWSSAAYSHHPLLPLRLLVFSLSGSVTLAESVAAPVLGFVLQLIYGAALGALFGVLMARVVGKLQVFAAAGVGGIYGLLVWMVGQYVVLAYFAPHAVILYDQAFLALSHVAYGLCLGLFGSAYALMPRILSYRAH